MSSTDNVAVDSGTHAGIQVPVGDLRSMMAIPSDRFGM